MLDWDVSDLASRVFKPEEIYIPPDPFDVPDNLFEELCIWYDNGYGDEYNHFLAHVWFLKEMGEL